jgi:hypothetical protein
MVFAGYLAASITVLAVLSVPVAADAASDTVGALAIVLMAVGAVHAVAAFRPTPGANGSLANEQALATAQDAPQAAGTRACQAQPRSGSRPEHRQTRCAARVQRRRIGRCQPGPGDVLASRLELTPVESAAVTAARDQFGRFSSPEELFVPAQLRPAPRSAR